MRSDPTYHLEIDLTDKTVRFDLIGFIERDRLRLARALNKGGVPAKLLVERRVTEEVAL